MKLLIKHVQFTPGPTTTVFVVTQLTLSVTVTVYVPAGKFDTVLLAAVLFIVEPTTVPDEFVQT